MSTSTQSISRRERERLLRRKEILAAARSVFARKGYTHATLDDVAELAEFGKGTLYNYFSNKEALFVSVLEDTFETLLETARNAFGSELPFSDQVEQFVHDELTLFFTDLESVQLVVREAHHLQGRNPLMQLMPQLLEVVTDRIGAEQRRERVIAHAEPRDMAAILLNMLFGQFSSRIHRRFGACMHDKSIAMDDISVVDLFKDVPTEEITREIEAMTRLIHTIYFQGIGV